MRIAIVEDNHRLAEAIACRLRDAGHACDVIGDGAEADRFLRDEGADLIVLDLTLPSLDGLDVLRALRRRQDDAPVLLLSARGDLEDRVRGLDAGADDYMIKPFEMDELEARIRALTRRKALAYSDVEPLGPLTFDRTNRTLEDADGPIDLPRRELAALECLLDRRGRQAPKRELADHIYGVGADIDETAVEPHLSRLRKRLAPYGVAIKSARGLGYMLVVEE